MKIKTVIKNNFKPLAQSNYLIRNKLKENITINITIKRTKSQDRTESL